MQALPSTSPKNARDATELPLKPCSTSPVSLPLGAAFCSDTGKGRKEPSWEKWKNLGKILLTEPALTNLKGHQASCFESTSSCTLSCMKISCGWIGNRHFKHKRSQSTAGTPTALFNNYIERGMAECANTVPSPGSYRAWGAHPLFKESPSPTEYQGYPQ